MIGERWSGDWRKNHSIGGDTQQRYGQFFRFRRVHSGIAEELTTWEKPKAVAAACQMADGQATPAGNWTAATEKVIETMSAEEERLAWRRCKPSSRPMQVLASSLGPR